MGEHILTLFIMATMLEAKPFIPGLGLKPISGKPFPVFENKGRILVISGIGKANAAAAACYGCMTFAPARVINAGAAGALDAAHPIGAIYQISRVIEHDRPDIFSGKPVFHQPDPVDGINSAVLATGDRPVIDPAERKRLSAMAELADMEAAAIVQTCRTMGVFCHVLKFVSDVPGHTAGLDIINNIRAFRTPFFDFCLSTVLPELD